MRKFLVIIEKTKTGFSAFCPDLPGCVATGKTRNKILKSMRTAIEFHLEGIKDEGRRIPYPKSSSTYMEVKAA